MARVCIVRGTVKPKSTDKIGGIVWLSIDEGCGQWITTFEYAHPYSSKKAAKQAVKDCPGPWYNIPEKDSIEYLEADYTKPQNAKLALTGHLWVDK